MPVRWSEDEFALFMRHMGVNRPQIQPVSEKAFMSAVVRLAKQHGWLCYHTWSSKKSPEGFPDLILAPGPDWQQRHPGQTPVLYAIELKTDTGQLTPAQAAWLEALGQCTGVVSEVWRPADLDAIVQRLRGATL
jgi:hypothetical protein